MDDEDWRHHEFETWVTAANRDRQPPPVDAYQCRTAETAISLLREGKPFDVVFLDHDLAGEHYNGGHGDCGCEVVEHIRRMQPLPNLVIVHSWNNVAGPDMVDRLIDEAGMVAGWIPFGNGIRRLLRG